MIVGFCGDKGIGKDTAAAYLIKEYGFQRLAFADKLKQSVAAMLQIPTHEIEMHKNADNVFVSIGYKNEPVVALEVDGAPNHMWSPISEMSFREFLQKYGTESHRDVFGEDFWVDQLLPVGGYYRDRKIVITDVRFQNEVDRINEIGGLVCRIKKMTKTIELQDAALGTQTHHRAEQAAYLTGVSYEIWNEGTIDELHGAVEEMVRFITSPVGGL